MEYGYKKVAYNQSKEYLMLDQKRKLGLVKIIKKQIHKFEITTEYVGLNIALNFDIS